MLGEERELNYEKGVYASIAKKGLQNFVSIVYTHVKLRNQQYVSHFMEVFFAAVLKCQVPYAGT